MQTRSSSRGSTAQNCTYAVRASSMPGRCTSGRRDCRCSDSQPPLRFRALADCDLEPDTAAVGFPAPDAGPALDGDSLIAHDLVVSSLQSTSNAARWTDLRVTGVEQGAEDFRFLVGRAVEDAALTASDEDAELLIVRDRAHMLLIRLEEHPCY